MGKLYVLESGNRDMSVPIEENMFHLHRVSLIQRMLI